MKDGYKMTQLLASGEQADIVSILSKNEIPYQKYQDAENNSLYDYI